MRAGLALGIALALTACSSLGQPQVIEYDMEVRSVEIPAGTPANAPLDVVVEVTVGGCTSFKRFEAQRTASMLRLRAIGNQVFEPGTVCPAYLGWTKHTYTDPGTPTRTGPFEVVVNGKSWGTVVVR
ncbi:hypothetical protein [Deinococcus koreensis]|uniref:Lipoprotein n=1 Tax=Deinococcus koreensis TaxID=2054903 RepID=A0A2K3V140_9DEIO|nr:hypothetical protein [Deinococcus koreensis]PNY82496.1 hypothetical protein CVO96_15075 [Deinococcus koreensis]